MIRWLRFFYDADGAGGGSTDSGETEGDKGAGGQTSTDEGGGEDNPWKGHFFSQLPKEFRESNKDALVALKDKGISIKDLVDSHLTTTRNAGRTLLVPTKDSTPEELKAYAERLGIPENPEAYGLDPKALGELDPDGSFTKSLAERLHKKAGNKEVVKEAFTILAETAKGALATKAAQDKEAALKFDERFAAKASEGIDDAEEAKEAGAEALSYFKRFMMATGNKALVKRLKDSGLAYDVDYALTMARFYKDAFGETPYIAGDPSGGNRRKTVNTSERSFQYGQAFNDAFSQ